MNRTFLQTSRFLLIAFFLICSSLSFASNSLYQAAYQQGTSDYVYGFQSIPEINVVGQPSDVDLSRWAMLHDKTHYRLYAFRAGSNSEIYQFAFNPSINAYEFGYNSIPVLSLEGAPSDADFSSFSMLHDGKDYRLYVKKKSASNVLYQFAYVPGTSKYQFGYNSIPEITLKGFPGDTDWTRWQMLHDGSAYRFYAFQRNSNTSFYQGAYVSGTHHYEFAYNSIPQLNLKGLKVEPNQSAAMLHDGQHYRFYRLK